MMRALLCGLAAVLLAAVVLTAGPARAGEADVVQVEAVGQRDGTWRFMVSVRHGDTGWDHYADKWDVVAPDGAVLGTRVLLHPHEREQPFTRSLGGVKIPAQITQVTLRAHDSQHGYGGAEVTVDLAR
jgi:hypothetical protein